MTAYNSQHARGGTQWLRRLARGCSWAVSMAAFADLDIRAGSDLKALRGLVETAAHRESVIFAPEPCPRYPSYHPVFSVVSPGAISVSRGVCLAEDAVSPGSPAWATHRLLKKQLLLGLAQTFAQRERTEAKAAEGLARGLWSDGW